MKKTSHLIFKVSFSILFTFYPAYPSAELSGKMIANACYTCHGGNLDTLKSSTPDLMQILLAFKQHKRPSTIMNRITSGYSDSELKAVATYLNEVH